MNPILLGILQALGGTIILTILSFFADASHLHGLVNPFVGGLIAALCLAIENAIQDSKGKGLFGTVKLPVKPA